MNQNEMQQADLVIVGGGMVGACLALALQHEELKIVLIESHPPEAQSDSFQPSFDDRHLALSQSSRRILSAIGVWSALEEFISPIRHIHVSEKGRFAQVRMDADSLGLDALGYVIIARALGEKLWQKLREQKNLTIYSPATVESFQQEPSRVVLKLDTNDQQLSLAASLLVFADGSNSAGRKQLGISVQEKDYAQTAMVANIHTELPHNDMAYERFTTDGPFALLPNGPDHMAMIYCLPSDQAAEQMQLSDELFLQAANQRFGRRLGRFLSISKRIAYPLKLIKLDEHFRGRALLLGNSAHTFHPNGAQGFNLCLRDVAGLRDAIVTSINSGRDIGSAQTLNHYLNMRVQDQKEVIEFSDGLCQWFYNDDPLKQCLRSMAMTGIDLVRPLKQQITLRATGLTGHQPQWVRHEHG